MITEFTGKYRALSNFYTCEVPFRGLTFLNSEAAFQSAKTEDEALWNKFTSLGAADSKKFGRKITLRPDWEEVKLKVMYVVLLNKFSHNEHLKKLLLDTKSQELIEGNYHHDNFWGVCRCTKCSSKIQGENMLGKLLMKIRDRLRAEGT